MSSVDVEKAVIFDGPETLGAWGDLLRAIAPYSPRGVPLAPCGTTAARQRHYQHGEDPCYPCRKAK